MPSLGRYCYHTMQRIRTQIVEMLCYWNSFVAFHASEVQATWAISSVVDLQNLLGTLLVLRFDFNLKTKQKPSSCVATADSRRAKRGLWRWVFIVSGLAASRVWHSWLQCRTQLASDDWLFRGVDWRVQRRWQAIKAEKERKKRLAIEGALA